MQPTQPTQPPPYEPETEPPTYQPDLQTASNFEKAENIKLYYRIASNYPPMKNKEEFLNKINNDISVLRNLALNSINLVIKNKIYAIRSDLITTRANYLNSIEQEVQPITDKPPPIIDKPPPNINQDKINKLNVRGKFLSDYLNTLNNNNIDTTLLNLVDKQIRARIGEIVNLVNRLTQGEDVDIESVLVNDLYADKGTIQALNAFNSLEKAQITDLNIATYLKYVSKITLEKVANTIRYQLTIDNNKYNQVFDSNGNLMTIPDTPQTPDTNFDTNAVNAYNTLSNEKYPNLILQKDIQTLELRETMMQTENRGTIGTGKYYLFINGIEIPRLLDNLGNAVGAMTIPDKFTETIAGTRKKAIDAMNAEILQIRNDLKNDNDNSYRGFKLYDDENHKPIFEQYLDLLKEYDKMKKNEGKSFFVSAANAGFGGIGYNVGKSGTDFENGLLKWYREKYGD